MTFTVGQCSTGTSSWNPHNNPRSRGWGEGCSPCPHFREQDIEAQRGEGTCRGHRGSECAGTWLWREVCVHSSPAALHRSTCFPAEGAAVTLQPSLATLLLLHLSLLLSCLLLIGWLLGHQSIASCRGHPFTSLSSSPGSPRKTIPETASLRAHAQVFAGERCPQGEVQGSTAGGHNSDRKAEERQGKAEGCERPG